MATTRAVLVAAVAALALACAPVAAHATGGATWQRPAPTPLPEGTLLEGLRAEADRIDALRLPYQWGGGHESSPANDTGPYDCSGAVSRLLQSVGMDVPTMTSHQYHAGAVGQDVTGSAVRYPVEVWAKPGHVLVVIEGVAWGTSTRNPGGGAGWVRSPGYLDWWRPQVRRFRLPQFESQQTHDFGQVLLTAAHFPGRHPVRGNVRLVAHHR